MLRVAHVIDSLAVGGTENGVVNLVNGLAGGFEHTVVTLTAGGPLVARLRAAGGVHCLGKRPGTDVLAIVRLARLLRRLAPDIVHSRNWGGFDAVPAARLARTPVVIHGEHGREAADPAGLNPRRNRLRRLCAPLVTRFVTVSSDLERWLRDTVGLPGGKVVRVPNGVDLSRFGPADRDEARRRLGVEADAIVIGTIGRLDPVKDQRGLLEAFARLPAPGRSRAALVIVGEGPCRAALEARLQHEDLAGRVRLLGERHDIPLLLAGLDVFVLSSIAEGMSNTILEAMASGLPVVATRTGGNPDLVDHDVTGALVDVGSPPALAAALGRYVADPDLRRAHGRAGRARAVSEFSLERMTARYADLYGTLAGRGAR